MLQQELNDLGNVLYQIGQAIQPCRDLTALQAFKEELCRLHEEFLMTVGDEPVRGGSNASLNNRMQPNAAFTGNGGGLMRTPIRKK